MALAILWFISRVLDHISTILLLNRGYSEVNTLWNYLNEGQGIGEFWILMFSIITSGLIFIVDSHWGKIKIIRGTLWLIVIFGYIIIIHNIVLLVI